MGLSVIVMLFSMKNSAVLQAVCSGAPWPAVLCWVLLSVLRETFGAGAVGGSHDLRP